MNWEQPKPLVGSVAQEGHVPFTYQFTAEELEYLKSRGFERSAVTPATRWIRSSLGDSRILTVTVTARGVKLVASPVVVGHSSKRPETITKDGMQLIPLLVWATIEGLL